jgi:hypothetical protein
MHPVSVAALTLELRVFFKHNVSEQILQDDIINTPFYQHLTTINLDSCLQELSPELLSELQQRIDPFYAQLESLSLNHQQLVLLKIQHRQTLTNVFNRGMNAFNHAQFVVGQPPMQDFMQGATDLFKQVLVQLIFSTLTNAHSDTNKLLDFITILTGLMLLVAQVQRQKQDILRFREKPAEFFSEVNLSTQQYALCA